MTFYSLMNQLPLYLFHIYPSTTCCRINCQQISVNCAADMAISTPSVITIEEQFGTENVTVVLEWAKEDHVQYNATTFPHVTMWYINKTIVQLTVPYNSPHKVSVVATLCGRNATNVTELHYGKLYNYG